MILSFQVASDAADGDDTSTVFFLTFLEGDDLSIGTPATLRPLEDGLVFACKDPDALKYGGLSIVACNMYLCFRTDDLADPYFKYEIFVPVIYYFYPWRH